MRRVAPREHRHGQGQGCCSGSTCSAAIRLVENPQRSRAPKTKRDKEQLMLDIVMLALGFGLFAVGIGYAYACERL
ncbi:MAG: hypothetical protein Q7T45_05065 [Bradyrhizobium sp.]|uniref:hypothetical protein n=1 Tax=Bradyrhizobium sp. TaxID=376 RepID=UPI0027278AA5|nr:hypothetical protein [Bradyrhizobium sp.]MDO8397170.1 hypothetical protein [Bradyrhizobium sp.]